MKLEEDLLKCVCGSWAKPTKLRIDGLLLDGWKCPKCGEQYLSSELSLKLSAFKRLQASPSFAVVTPVGNSIAIRVKKEVVQALGLKPGEKLRVVLPSLDKIELSVISS